MTTPITGSRTSETPGTECAVVGCEHEGTPHLCPYDERRHYHGAIHYNCSRAEPTTLTFKKDGWFWICEAHYQHLLTELHAREGAKASR